MQSLVKFGYIGMTADFLHIGHINALKEAKNKCEKLFVGIMTDDCVLKYKGAKPTMNQDDRAEIIRSIKFVSGVFLQDSFEYPHHIFRLKNFYGDDFIIFDSEEHKRDGADVIIKRTNGISSSKFKETLEGFDYSQLPL